MNKVINSEVNRCVLDDAMAVLGPCTQPDAHVSASLCAYVVRDA